MGVRCSACQNPLTYKRDPTPQYEINYGKYVVRIQSCPLCPRAGNQTRHVQRHLVPVDKSIETIRVRQTYRHL